MFKVAGCFLCFICLGSALYNFTDETSERYQLANRYNRHYYESSQDIIINLAKVASQCKTYYCRSGNDYVMTFEVKSGHRSPRVKFEMHMAIKGGSDGHILLSSTAKPMLTDPVYEIVVGAGGNTYSELRRLRKRMGKTNVQSPGILDPNKNMPFWIKVFDDGVVEFGKEGEDLALLSYRDPDPLEINYFSFASWNGFELKVLYDCPKPGGSANETTPQSEVVKVEPNLTSSSRLRVDLLKNYDRYSRPPLPKNTSQTMIFLHFSIKSIKYDAAKSILTSHGTLITGWIDERLQWNASKYNNMTDIIFNHKDIWTPELILYDSLDLDLLRSDPSLRMVLDSDGFVQRIQSVHARTWCAPGARLSHWPHDRHICPLKFGFWAHDNSLVLMDLRKELSASMLKNMDDRNAVSTEWEILEIIRTSQWSNSSPYASLLDAGGSNHNLINVTITVSRKSNTYTMLLFTPFVVSIIIVLTTFWLPSSQVIKMTLVTVNMIFVSICLTEVLNKMPTYMLKLPNIVRFYLWAIFSMWLSLIVHGILFKLTTSPRPWPYMHHRLQSLLTSSPFAMALALPTIKNQDTYKPMQENPSSQPLDDNSEDNIYEVDEHNGNNDEDLQYWMILVTAVDRIMFTVLVIGYSAILFTHY